MELRPLTPKRLLPLLAFLLAALLSVVGATPPAHAITNGQDAADPVGAVQILLGNRTSYCTGILINPAWVLTAKHCTNQNGVQAANTKVILNDLRFDQGERHDVLAIFENPANDTALLQLTVRTNKLEMVVPYGSDDPVVGAPAAIKGWGGTQANQNAPASTLQIGQNIVAAIPQNSDTMTLTSSDGSRTTNGDSGAPVIINGLVCGVHSSTGVLSSTAVKSSAISSWIYQTARVFPGGACDLDTSKKKPNGLAQRIMAIGSAETSGYNGDAIGYRSFLKSMLSRSGLPSSFVGPDSAGPPPDNSLMNGLGNDEGYLIEDLEDEAKCVVYDYAPDIVTIVAGEMDIAYFEDVPDAPARFDSMIDTIQEVSPRTVILVASIAPSTDSDYGPLITQFNASVKERVMTRVNRGQHVGYVDTGDLVTSTSEPQSLVQDGYSHDNGPVELYPSGFFKQGAGFNLAINEAVNSGWIPDNLVLNKGPCNSTDPGAGSSSTVPLRVMPTGDSITQGFQSTPGGFGNGYRYELQQRVQSSGQTIDFVGENTDGPMTDGQNEGFSGKEIDYIAGRAIPYAAAARPNVVTLLAGTNDLGNNADIAGAPGRLDTMIGGLFRSAPDATLLVAGIPPSREGGFNSKREVYNASVRSLVAARANSGQHIQYVDMNDLDPNADMADDLHPDPSGYTIMGENFAEAIKDVAGRGWVTEPVPAQDTGGGLGSCVDQNTWYPQEIITLGNGVGTGPEVHLADLNGDGRDDYLNVYDNGSVHAYINNGGQPNDWNWDDYGTIAGGVGVAGRNVMFADTNGDGRDDYLAVGEQGRVDVHINGGGAPGNWIWYDEGKIADGVNKQIIPPAEVAGELTPVNLDQLSFADINGDGRDDYIVSRADSGYAEAWLLTGDPFHPTLLPQETIAWGVGSGDTFPTFANIDCAGRADYLRPNSVTGAVTGHRNNGPIPTGGYSWSEILPNVAYGDSANGQLVFADMNGDGRDDYIYLTNDGALVNVYLRG